MNCNTTHYRANSSSVPGDPTLQYHFHGEKVSPFVGVGLNYTLFFSTDSAGPLAGTNLDLDNSWGMALHAGLDFKLSGNRSLRVDARWIDIDTDVRVNGARVGTVNIDPVAYGAAFVWAF